MRLVFVSHQPPRVPGEQIIDQNCYHTVENTGRGARHSGGAQPFHQMRLFGSLEAVLLGSHGLELVSIKTPRRDACSESLALCSAYEII